MTRLDRDDLLRDDEALDLALGSLGVPPAARPKAGAIAILAGLAAGAPPAAAAGIATWKVVALVLAGTTLGISGGYVLNDVVREVGRPAFTEEQLAAVCESVHDEDVPVEETAPVAMEPVPSAPVLEPAAVAEEVRSAAPGDRRIARVTSVRVAETGPGTIDVETTWGPGLAPDLDGLSDDDDWIPDPESYEVERKERAADDRSGEAARPLQTRVEVDGAVRDRGEPRSAETRFRLAAGAVTSAGQWNEIAPPAGLDLRLGVVQLGRSRAVARPLAAGDADLTVLPGDGGRPTRFVGALQGSAGIALDGRRTRFDLSWAVAGRLMPAAPGADGVFDPGAGWLWVSTGPQFGLAVTPRTGPVFTAVLSAQASALDLDDSGTKSIQPWIGLVAGAELPVRRRR